jgi:hypothetical protein
LVGMVPAVASKNGCRVLISAAKPRDFKALLAHSHTKRIFRLSGLPVSRPKMRLINKLARILFAKPVSTFAEYARKGEERL